MNRFPGGVAVTDLVVYDWEAIDGRCGGSPHAHTASSEGYVVVAGTGSVHTLSADGAQEHPLAPGDIVWFSPGTVHRLVNDGELRLLVVMSNAGLPEAGDAVFTFPAGVLDDAEAYAAAAVLPLGAGREAAARARRDLAMIGYLELQTAMDGDGAAALAAFHRRAAQLVRSRVPDWRRLWEATVAEEVDETRARLDELARGESTLLAAAGVERAEPMSDGRSFGMCGMLRTWEWPSSATD